MPTLPFQREQTDTGWRFLVLQRITPIAGTLRQRMMRALGTPLAAALLPALYFVLFDAWVQANNLSGALYGVGLAGVLIPLLLVGRIRSHWGPRMVLAQIEIRSNTLVVDAWTKRRSERRLERWVSEFPLHRLADGTDEPVTFNGPQKERFLSWTETDGARIIPHLQCNQANGTQLAAYLNAAILEAKVRHGCGHDEVPNDLRILQQQRNDISSS